MSSPSRPPARWLVQLYDRVPDWVRRAGVRLVMPTYPLAVAVVVFNSQGEVLVLKHTYGRPAWRLPGGLVERREEVLRAATREVQEEASCTIAPIGLADAAATGASFDLAVAAVVVADHPFVVNPETVARMWMTIDQTAGLPRLQQRFVHAAAVLWQSNRRDGASGPHTGAEADG